MHTPLQHVPDDLDNLFTLTSIMELSEEWVTW